MERINETIQTPVAGHYDVIVLGGGVAGCAAAVAAARAGSSVLLVEKMTVLGGLATAGHVVIYLPICDGRGNKMAAGLAEELLQLSIRHGRHDLPDAWKDGPLHADTTDRYRVTFLAGNFALELERLMAVEGVTLLYDALFCAPVMEGSRCVGVALESKSGREVYLADAFVDATGDGDLLARAGAPMGEQSNFLTYWSYVVPLDEKKGLQIQALGDCCGGGLPEWGRGKYYGTSLAEVNRFLKDSHRLAYETLVTGKEDTLEMASFPSMAQFRTTRYLEGAYTLTEQDEGRAFPDTVGAIGDWRTGGKVYQIPYRALYCEQVDNVLPAGRNIAAKGDTWEVTRVIPTAVVTGQAAGAAAALIAREKTTTARLDVPALQDLLEQQGVLLSPEVEWR